MSGACRLLPWPDPRPRQNPYQRVLYAGLRGHGITIRSTPPLFSLVPLVPKFEWLHLNWPERLLEHPDPTRRSHRLEGFLRVIRRVHRRGARVVWTVHNELPHETADLGFFRDLNEILARESDLVHVHTEETGERFVERYGADPAKLHLMPHPHYGDAHGPRVPRPTARAEIGIPADARLLLSFGNIREYKGLMTAVEAFLATSDSRLRYMIAGKPGTTSIADALRSACRRDDRILLELSEVPDRRVAPLFSAADACVLSSTSYLTSGSLVLALTYGVPVIAAPIAHARTFAGTTFLREWAPATTERLTELMDGLAEWLPDVRRSEIEEVRSRLDPSVVTRGLASRLREIAG